MCAFQNQADNLQNERADEADSGTKGDSPIQVVLAYSCFVTMVLVTLCVFMPAEVSFAASRLIGII